MYVYNAHYTMYTVLSVYTMYIVYTLYHYNVDICMYYS